MLRQMPQISNAELLNQQPQSSLPAVAAERPSAAQACLEGRRLACRRRDNGLMSAIQNL
jgi:hypothetical protein